MQIVAMKRASGVAEGEAGVYPLTHHEIIRLVAPFARAGRHVDLSRSDRGNRVIAFQPIEHQGETPLLAGLCETLQLENPRPRLFRLTRGLQLAGGLRATLQAEASDPSDLVAQLEAMPPASQFRCVAGTMIAFSYDLRVKAGATSAAAAQIALARAEARVGGLTLTLMTSRVAGTPGIIDLVPDAGRSFQLPEDLLAVLGSDWTILQRRAAGWRGTLRVRRGTLRERTALLEASFERAVAHVAATLARPPAEFHATLRGARWLVALRRSMPLLTFLGLMGGVWGSSFVTFPPGSIIRFLIVSSPTILLIGAFTMPNRPTVEIPALPRRLSRTAWPEPPTCGGGS